MKDVAIIEAGAVVNVIVVDDATEDFSPWLGEGQQGVETGGGVSPGWTYSGGQFTAPPQIPDPATLSPEVNGAALTERKRQEKKEAIANLIDSIETPEAEALRNLLELL